MDTCGGGSVRTSTSAVVVVDAVDDSQKARCRSLARDHKPEAYTISNTRVLLTAVLLYSLVPRKESQRRNTYRRRGNFRVGQNTRTAVQSHRKNTDKPEKR